MHGTPKPHDNNPHGNEPHDSTLHDSMLHDSTLHDSSESDQQKSDTPDKHRNEDGIGKAPDQPEQTDDRDPDRDYPDAQVTRVDR